MPKLAAEDAAGFIFFADLPILDDMKLKLRSLAWILAWIGCLPAVWQPCFPSMTVWLAEEESAEPREPCESRGESATDEAALSALSGTRWQRRHHGQRRAIMVRAIERRAPMVGLTGLTAPLGQGSREGRGLPMHC